MFYITEKKKYELHEINLKKLRKYFTKGRSIYRKGLGFSITLVCVPHEKTSSPPLVKVVFKIISRIWNVLHIRSSGNI